MANEPKVTGLSPKEGPPGTKITVRGENLGQSSDDIIRLTVNGADCLPYLEWKSSTKIITRCTKVFGSGDIVITTSSGGLGTCDVQFECKKEFIGLFDESSVWVDELDNQTPERESFTIPGLIEDHSNISSSKFNPELYLKYNHSDASLLDLERLHRKLQADLAVANDPEVVNSGSNKIVSMKSNLPAIMECLQILEHLSKIITTSKDTSIDNIVISIRQNLSKTHKLFDPLLAQKDLVQSIENAMHVFKQNEAIFNLPSAIENSIKSKNYDYVVKEISGVLARLKTINIEPSLTEKIELDVNAKVDKLKSTIEAQLHQSCRGTNGGRNIDEVKKLISHLNRLGGPVNYDVWFALKEMSGSLIDSLSEQFDHFLELSLSEAKLSPSHKTEPPYLVRFVQSAMSIFHNTYYDILTLGQCYFDPKDEFSCKESEEIKQTRIDEFEEMMISEPIKHLCNLLRQALIPNSPELREKLSNWPSDESEGYVNRLNHVLQSVINCYITLTKVNLSPTAHESLDKFKEFVFELRIRSVEILFHNATRFNKNLHHKEDWLIEVDDLYGGTTKLPLIFEKNVIETLRFANKAIFKTSLPDEQSILKQVPVQGQMKELAQSLINSFIDSLDNALIDSKEHPAESNIALLASRDSTRAPSKYMNRLLITICNCQYTRDQLFIRLQDEFEKLEGLKMDRVFKNCSKKYSDYINKISEKFCRIKCSELNNSLKAKSSTIEDSQLNLMIVNSQIFLVAPQLVNDLTTSIINSMQMEQTTVQRL